MATITMLDLARAAGHDKAVGLIEESIVNVPEIGIFPTRQIVGTTYDTLIRTALPTASFTQVGAGIAASKSTFERRRTECYVLQSRLEVPKVYADGSEEGPEWWQMVEAMGAGLAAMRTLATQLYYGTASGTYGFTGFKEATPVSGANGIVTDAGGSTATTASSAYFVKFGVQDVQLIAGRNATLQIGQFREESIEDPSGNKMPGYVGHLLGWFGLGIHNRYSVSRIYNLTADSGKGLTDSLINTHLAKLPVGKRPDVILVSRRSNTQLQNSRTVVLNSGPGASKVAGSVEAIAPRPTESAGIPIIESDSILDTDAIGS